MAKLLYHFAKIDFSVKAFTVDAHCIETNQLETLPVIPFEDIASEYPAADHKMIIAVGFIQMNELRQQRFLQAKEMGYEFINYIHPSVSLNNVIIGINNIILDYVSIHPGSVIGNSNFISSNTNIGHDCEIGDACWINSGTGIGGGTSIKDNCFFGINATIGHGIVLKEKTFIGANSLQDKDTEVDSVYLSNKAEKFRLSSQKFLGFSNSL